VGLSWRQPVAVAIAMAFVVAACGDDDDNAASTSPAASGPSAAATTAASAATSASTGTTSASAAASTASSSAGTAGEASGEYGLIDGVYKGPNDFTLDPADCPDDWDPNQGITDTEIKLFNSLPKAGPFAGFGLAADGAQSYFKYVNENGGVDGRQIVLDVKDDGYQPDKTKSNVDEALGSNAYAALYAVLGTPNNLAIWDEVNDDCMPQLFNGSGAPQWGDIENHSWTTGAQIDYFTEASLWAEWLKKEHPDAKTVASVAFNNDFGKSYVNGFTKAIEGTDIKVVSQQYHEPTAANLTNQFTTMAATKADVVLVESSGTYCTQAMSELEKNPDWKPVVIISSTCQSLSQFFQPLIDQGQTGAGAHLITYVKDPNDPAWANDPEVQKFHEVAKAQGLDDKQTTYATGWLFAIYMENVLKQAAKYQGGLDRGNIMLAARNIDFNNPLVIDGIKQQTAGAKDAYLNEGGQMVVYKVSDPKQLGTFVPDGDLIDLNGSIGNYSDISPGG
jgi:branched-chain amino acid transport system substrate-binding protein